MIPNASMNNEELRQATADRVSINDVFFVLYPDAVLRAEDWQNGYGNILLNSVEVARGKAEIEKYIEKNKIAEVITY